MSDLSPYTERDWRHLKTFNVWLITGALFATASTILIGKAFIPAGVLAWTLTVVTIALLALAVRAFMVFLRAADELVRKVQLDALAFAFGSSIVFMMGYRLCERLGAPKLDINDPALVMLVVWAMGQWVGFRRYASEEADQ